jgi:hypothetical protein
MRALHFVGFKDDRYLQAVRVFGRPDFIHRKYDLRAVQEIAEHDVVLFADNDEHQAISPFTYDDSAFF